MCLAQGCDTRAEIEAKVWRGKHVNAEIVRDEVCTPEMAERGECKEGEVMERFLPAAHPSFDEFRCMRKDYLDNLIEEALRHCK